DDENRLFMVFSDHQRGQGVTVAYSENEARNDWQFIDLATNDNMRWWEPKYDLNRWKEDGVLSMLYQPVGNGLAPTPVSILEWNARAFFNGSLVLEVDRATGAVALRNTTDAALGLSGYSIASSGNQLAPGLWRSLADQGATGWTESSALAASLAEASGTPLSIASGGSRSLGRAYAGQALAFGVDAPADLVFETTIGGQTVVGQVVYTGASSNNLTLMVDPQTGEARLKNTSPFSVAIDGYSIASASDSLSPAGWTSLDDQNAAGGDWVEANVDSGVLTELKPTANTLLAGGDTYSLGNLFSAATGMQDLTFGFLKAGANALTAGVVLYTPVTPSADFDNDNDVDGADFVLWQRGLGRTIDATQAEGDADHDFDVDAADLAIWRSSFGTAGAAAAAGAVPEPGAATLLALAGLGCVAAGGRRGRAATA
ncbi:MAG TPA: hypothetical protein VEQ85_03395, partial [Lacipirellulaceae bacterium]|nr:hypothetical protein [Lacipirellulaceae bacterium]